MTSPIWSKQDIWMASKSDLAGTELDVLGLNKSHGPILFHRCIWWHWSDAQLTLIHLPLVPFQASSISTKTSLHHSSSCHATAEQLHLEIITMSTKKSMRSIMARITGQHRPRLTIRYILLSQHADLLLTFQAGLRLCFRQWPWRRCKRPISSRKAISLHPRRTKHHQRSAKVD